MARKKKEIEEEETEDFDNPAFIYEVPDPISNEVEIIPNKDHRIIQNDIDIVITAGEPVTIPRKFLQNMVTEKIIDKIPQ